MGKILVEVCCGSADDVIESELAGADRVELNSNLFQGGLTPTIGEFLVARSLTKIPIMAMIRPREGGFCYTDAEFQTALTDAKILLENGADGIVFGFLRPDGTIDVDRCREMINLIGKKESVFHRAIDVVPDWRRAIDTLVELGVTRILTSGQASSAINGAQTIAEMIKYAGERVQILPGAGIKKNNVKNVLAGTGCTQVHISLKKACYDTSTSANTEIFFGSALYPPEDRFHMIDRDSVHDFCSSLDPV